VIHVVFVGGVRLSGEGVAVLLGRDSRLRVTTSSIAGELANRVASADVVVVDTAHDRGPLLLRDVVDVARAPVVALGVPEDERDVIAFAELGVMGFVERDASLEELIACILSVNAGDASFPPRIATTLLRRVSSLATRQASADVTALTVRERQVVQLIAEGLSNKEIATRLCIEVATVKNHVHNILEKLQVSRRFDAVARMRIVEGRGPAPTVFPVSEVRSISRSTVG